jgi:glutathione S-transferase
MASLKLLGPAYTRTFRCLWMLEELGVPYLHVEEASPASRAVKEFQPSGKVPVLLDYSKGDNGEPFVLTESVAINTYLADCHGAKDSSLGLVPAVGTTERAFYDQTVCCILSELDAQALWMVRKHNGELAKIFGAIPDIVPASQTQFHSINKLVAKQLQPYVLGSTFTAADILYVNCLDWAQMLGWNSDNHWPNNIDAYLELCRQRPAYQRAQAMRVQSLKLLKQKSKM